MRTRLVTISLCAVLVALCASADAQQSARISRIGYLSDSDPTLEFARAHEIRQALRERGYN
jgi:hypothetical protein